MADSCLNKPLNASGDACLSCSQAVRKIRAPRVLRQDRAVFQLMKFSIIHELREATKHDGGSMIDKMLIITHARSIYQSSRC